MMTMTFEPQAQPINITPMSAQEARECIAVIKGNLESLYLMLLDLHRRRGWEALGYASWEDCATEEFGRSRAYVFRLLAAAQVQENLVSAAESTTVDLKDIPVSQLTELAKLPPPQQAEGLALADQIAQTDGKKRNAAHVAQAVQEIKPRKVKNQMPTTQTDEQTLVADNADDTGIQQSEPDQPESPSTSTAPRPTQMLSAAVESCLGDFTMPASLDEPLQGVVYVSPHQAVEKWVSKLLKAFKDGEVTEAIALLPLDPQLFLWFSDSALCPITNGFVAVYLGTRLSNFVLCFEDIGTVWHRYGWQASQD